ncbi:unnamed protein product [Fraxinus pennsylvanica]|uniref:Peptidase C1A papain C-terminal domain-containing protein n=1 Tax=Fraxinus pennsylvanica TaxID=56036 RepID=A0AAD1YMH5_9LAMI|nr:unnamed protein product [Fraxinus pennsylvanica]
MFLGTRTEAKLRFVKSKIASQRYAIWVGENLPEFFDWRKERKLLGFLDCCCRGLESINQIVIGELIPLSEQELVDCDRIENSGCNGGLMDYAFQFIIANGGMAAWTLKMITPTGGLMADVILPGLVFFEFFELIIISYDPIKYKDSPGVFTARCGTDLDHGVVVVGYGTENGLYYWIVRNSWETNCGENGYIRIQRNALGIRSGKCGIAIKPSYPTKTKSNLVHASV